MAEMAPDAGPVSLSPDGGPKRISKHAEESAKGFPDLYDAATKDKVTPSFKQVIQACQLINHPEQDEDAIAGNWLMPRLRDRFAQAHEGLQKDYYCQRAVGGCLLASDRSVHSILNSPPQALATAEFECKVVAREAGCGFAGKGLSRQLEEATDHAYSALTRVMSAADEVADPGVTETAKAKAISGAVDEVAAARRRVDVLLQRQSRYEYFQGMLWGALPTIIVAAGVGVMANQWWRGNVSPGALAGAITMGALGAIISVIQRMSNGSLVVDYTAPASQRRVLGGLRPAVGGAFGAVAYFALLTGILSTGSTVGKGTISFAVFPLVGFAAGFSERFATDMLERSGQLLGIGATGSSTRNRAGRAARQ